MTAHPPERDPVSSSVVLSRSNAIVTEMTRVGCAGGHYVEERDTQRRRFSSVRGLFAGDRRTETYVSVSTGWGVWGHLYDRDVERVRRDVRDDIISRSAAEVFGVVLSAGGELAVDVPATSRKRRELRQAPGPAVSPTKSNAATWLQANLRAADEYFLNARL